MTLNALSTALEGRGDELGENLETVDAYLKRINPQIPGLVEDLRLTAQVSDTYADVLPEVAQILDNTITTSQTLEGREAQLHALFQDIVVRSPTPRAPSSTTTATSWCGSARSAPRSCGCSRATPPSSRA